MADAAICAWDAKYTFDFWRPVTAIAFAEPQLNWMSFIGLFFVLVVLFFPRGVLGVIRRKAGSRRGSSSWWRPPVSGFGSFASTFPCFPKPTRFAVRSRSIR